VIKEQHGKFTPLLIIVFAVAVSTGLYLIKPAPKAADNAVEPLLVSAIEAVKQSIQVSVRAQGTVNPGTATTVIAEVAGKIVEVSENFMVGGFFKKGDALLRIDQRDFIANVKRAEAAVASAQSQLATEKGKAEVAYQDWVKYKGSVKRSAAATDLALRKPQLEEARASLHSAQAELEQARIQLDRTIIRAPYDGIFKTQQVDIGQYVNVGATLAEVFAVDKAELRLAIPPHKLDYLQLPRLGDSAIDQVSPVRLSAEIGGKLLSWNAKLVRTEAVFDERSRVLFAVAEIEDPYGIYQRRGDELRMGTFVDAHIAGRKIENLIALPRSLVRTGNRIWVIDENQRIHNRKISTLRTDGDQVFVTSGLEAGELVCATSYVGAVPGTQVRVSETVRSTAFSGEATDTNLFTPAAESMVATKTPEATRVDKSDIRFSEGNLALPETRQEGEG